MKRVLAVFLSFVFVLQTTFIPSVSAARSDLDEEQIRRITVFLQNHQVVNICLRGRKDQELKPLTKIIASCLLLRVFDAKEKLTLGGSWKKSLDLGFLSKEDKQGEELTGFEYLALLFQAAGVTISPISQQDYEKIFLSLNLRVRGVDRKILATALENGLFAEPKDEKEGKIMVTKLSRTPFPITKALAHLYQVATSKDQETTIIFDGGAQKGQELVLEGILKEVVKTIKTQGYFSAQFDEKKAMEAAIKAVVKALKDDKYIEYYSEDEYKSFSSSLNGSLEGIGAYIEQREGEIIIVSPIEGSPASKGGLQPEDAITHINDESTKDLTLQQAVDKIRGPRGTNVKLTIRRQGQPSFDILITREKISVPALTVTNKDGIEIIKLVQFSASSAKEMEAELKTLSEKGVQGLIIDLRNNPGGFLNEVTKIANFFIRKGEPLVVLKDREGESAILAKEDPIVSNLPMAVLINKGSASASEILAGLLQSYKLARVYGETTFGKGTVQTVLTLRDSNQETPSGFKLTTSEYLVGSPNGEKPVKIDGVGVKPFDNPGGPDNALLDDKKTVPDEALDTVLGIMRK